MQAVDKGAIINISSVHSRNAVKGVALYTSSKSAITTLARNLAIEHDPTIRVGAIARGWIPTLLIQSIFDSYPDLDNQRRQVMKWIGRPEDIDNVVTFPASDEVSFITGTQIFVDGYLAAQLKTWLKKEREV